MALSNAQLLVRIETIETKLNEMQTAMNNLVSRSQMKALTNVRQSEVVDLQARVETLESEIAILQDAL
jgi:predicted nuclease with TOPRIM domain